MVEYLIQLIQQMETVKFWTRLKCTVGLHILYRLLEMIKKIYLLNNCYFTYKTRHCKSVKLNSYYLKYKL